MIPLSSRSVGRPVTFLTTAVLLLCAALLLLYREGKALTLIASVSTKWKTKGGLKWSAEKVALERTTTNLEETREEEADKNGIQDSPELQERQSRVEPSLNQRLSLQPASPNSAVQLYCDDPSDCWEPQDLSGTWIELDHAGENSAGNETRSSNHCPGWGFGQLCDNGYARNVECPAERGKLAYHDQYIWMAEGLPFFNATKTCSLLGSRLVLLIGDSTMGQTASTLINQLLPGGCQDRIHYRRADTLVKKHLGTVTLEQQLRRRLPGMNRGPHWKKAVEKNQPDIVIFSFGAHVYGENRWKDAFDEVVNGMMAYNDDIKSLANATEKATSASPRQRVQFVYKTISPGGCSKTISSLRPDLAARNFTHYLFNHGTFYGRDMYALARLKQLQWPVLDMRMLYARTDSHPSSRFWPHNKKDCLHWCTPGPLDVVATLFQERLEHELRLETEELYSN